MYLKSDHIEQSIEVRNQWNQHLWKEDSKTKPHYQNHSIEISICGEIKEQNKKRKFDHEER